MEKSLKLHWLRTALNNLATAAAYIATDHPLAAQKFIDQIEKQLELLSLHPYSGRSGRISGTRELVINHYPFIIPYRVRKDRIEVLRIFHTSRQYPPK